MISSFRKKIILILVLVVAFIDWLGIGLVYPMFSSMVFDKTFGLLPENTTDTVRGFYLGILLAGLSITQFFSAPILGSLSDAKGRKKILIYSILIGAFGYFLAVIAVMHQHMFLLIFSRLVIGVSTGSAAIASACIADISASPEEKTKNFGLFNMANGLGFTVGPFLGGHLSTRGFEPFVGFSFPFFIAGVVLLINAILMVFFFQETHFLKKPKKLNWAIGIHNLVKAFRHHNLRILFIVTFFFAFGWSFFWEFIPVTWIKRYNLTASEIGSLYAFASGVYAFSSAFLIRPLVNRFKPSPILFYALAVQGVYMFLFLIPMNLPWVWVYIPLQQLLIALTFPTVQSLVSNKTSDDMQGEILGVMQSVMALGFILSPLISAPLLGITSEMPMIVGGIAFFIASVILAIFLKRDVFTPSSN